MINSSGANSMSAPCAYSINTNSNNKSLHPSRGQSGNVSARAASDEIHLIRWLISVGLKWKGNMKHYARTLTLTDVSLDAEDQADKSSGLGERRAEAYFVSCSRASDKVDSTGSLIGAEDSFRTQI